MREAGGDRANAPAQSAVPSSSPQGSPARGWGPAALNAYALADELLEPLRRGKGARVVAVGVTGSGKSHALRELVSRAAEQLDVVFVIDDSEDAGGWDGQRRIDLADCTARPLVGRDQGGSNVVVLEGDVLADRPVDCEVVAAEAWRLVTKGLKVAVVFDELRRATVGPQRWHVQQGKVAKLFTEGRKYGLSAFAATNFPQEIPREALGQSDMLAFVLDGGERIYLERKRLVSPELALAIARLQLRQFVVRRVGALTDPRVYAF